MAADDLSTSLIRLRKSAQQMNDLTDSINAAFQAVERFLTEECSLGIEAWAGAGELEDLTYEVGYCKVEKSWRICLRPTAFDGKPYDTPRAWDQFGRDAKLLAVNALPELIMALQNEVARRINNATSALAKIERALSAPADKVVWK